MHSAFAAMSEGLSGVREDHAELHQVQNEVKNLQRPSSALGDEKFHQHFFVFAEFPSDTRE